MPEFLFGQLDFLLKYRPNASVLCNEAYLMYSHNKTKEWLNTLDDTTREQYLNECRKESKGLREKCHARLKEIEQSRFDVMKRKEKELAEKKKEGFTNDILYFGLWQSQEDVTFHLNEIHD